MKVIVEGVCNAPSASSESARYTGLSLCHSVRTELSGPNSRSTLCPNLSPSGVHAAWAASSRLTSRKFASVWTSVTPPTCPSARSSRSTRTNSESDRRYQCNRGWLPGAEVLRISPIDLVTPGVEHRRRRFLKDESADADRRGQDEDRRTDAMDAQT